MTDEQNKQIEQLYRELFGCLTAYALSVLRSRPLAEETVQETFRIACTRPEALCKSPNPRGWLQRQLDEWFAENPEWLELCKPDKTEN